jgi:hypothetical protein
VVGVERQGETAHESNLQVVISAAKLPNRSSIMATRAGVERFAALQPYYSITLGRDFWVDLRSRAVPLLLPVMRAFATRPLAWHFVQYVHWRSYVTLRAAAHGHTAPARIDWHELRLMLGSTTRHDKQLRRELRTVLTDLKFLWPECNAQFDRFTLCIGAPTSGVTLVESRERRFQRRAEIKWRRLLAQHSKVKDRH